MAKKITGYIKLQIPAGKANPAPPIGPALGQHGVNIMKTVSDSILEEVVKNAEYSNASILKLFYVTDDVTVEKGKLFINVKSEGDTHLVGMRADEDIKDKKEDVTRKGKKVTFAEEE